jgi:hypothetical protein
MKEWNGIIKSVLLSLVLSVVFSLPALSQVVGKIEKAGGRVSILKKGNFRGISYKKVRGKIEVGDVVRTKRKSFADISFIDKTKIRLEESSRLIVEKYIPGKETTINSPSGKVVYRVTKVTRGAYRIKTPTALIGVKGTELATIVDSGVSVVVVREGAVEVVNPELPHYRVVVKRNMATVVKPGKPPAKPVTVGKPTIEKVFKVKEPGKEEKPEEKQSGEKTSSTQQSSDQSSTSSGEKSSESPGKQSPAETPSSEQPPQSQEQPPAETPSSEQPPQSQEQPPAETPSSEQPPPSQEQPSAEEMPHSEQPPAAEEAPPLEQPPAETPLPQEQPVAEVPPPEVTAPIPAEDIVPTEEVSSPEEIVTTVTSHVEEYTDVVAEETTQEITQEEITEETVMEAISSIELENGKVKLNVAIPETDTPQ